MTSPSPTHHPLNLAQLSSGERYLYQLFSSIKRGNLRVTNPSGKTFQFGHPEAQPALHLKVLNPKTYDRILSFGPLGFCEAYMDGWWEEENNNLSELTGLFYREDVYATASAKPSLALIAKILLQRLATVPTSIKNSYKNVQYHYDLGNDFYQLFLDPTLTYSCGYQQTPADSLETMQRQKYELICRKLALQPGETLVDIGCGWGGMLIYAAEHYGISGTGITLSQEQAKLARDRIAERGLGDRLTIQIQDYRELRGQFDRFISIGMFEHVGRGSFAAFMAQARDLLKPNGTGLLHTIVTESAERNGPWVDKYIFPGGYAPQLHELTKEMLTAKLTIADCENLKPHYAETLRHWKENFVANRDAIAALSPQYNDRFMRMWYLYLQSFEASFRYGTLQIYQLLFFKDKQWTLGIPTPFATPLVAKK